MPTIQRFRSLALLVALNVCALVPVAASAAPPPVASQLTAAQVAKLRTVRLGIAVPAYVPSGFHLASVAVHPCVPSKFGGCRIGTNNYAMTYRKNARTSFSVSGVTSGIGDVIMPWYTAVPTAHFGMVRVYFQDGPFTKQRGGRATPAQVAAVHDAVISDWAGSFAAPPHCVISVSGEHISAAQVAKIVAALTYL